MHNQAEPGTFWTMVNPPGSWIFLVKLAGLKGSTVSLTLTVSVFNLFVVAPDEVNDEEDLIVGDLTWYVLLGKSEFTELEEEEPPNKFFLKPV